MRFSLASTPVQVGIVALAALPLLLLPISDAALLVGIGTVVVLALKDPVWALYAAVLSVPLQDKVALPGGMFYPQAALLLVAFTWLLHILAHPERRVRAGHPFVALLLLLWFLALATAATPYDQSESIKEMIRWSTVVLVYLAARNTLATPDNHNTTPATTTVPWRVVGLVICLLLATSANAVIGLWQFVTASGPESFGIADGRFVRAYGTIGQPNSFAGYMNMGWPMAAALTVGLGREWRQHRTTRAMNVLLWGSTIALRLLLAALLASMSRGGWVGALGGALALMLAAAAMLPPTARQRAWRWSGIGVAAIVAVMIMSSAGVLPATLAKRISSITHNVRLFDVRTVEVSAENFAVVERMSHIQAGWRMVQHNPITGVGPGNFTHAYEGSGAFQAQPFALHPWYTSQGHAHNYYLNLTAEAGVGALLAYLLLLALLAHQAYTALRHTRHWFLRCVIAGCCGIIGAVAIHNLFENLHVLNMGIQLGAVWGLLTSLAAHQQNLGYDKESAK